MARVGALNHQIGRNDAALPGRCNSGSDLIPLGAVGARDSGGVHSVNESDLDLLVGNRFLDIFKRGVDIVGGIEAHI